MKRSGKALAPIYSISNDCLYAVSLDFRRLQRLRPGYGYEDLPDTSIDQKAPENQGLWLMDLKTGQSELIISLADI